jgi:hypothetical protein
MGSAGCAHVQTQLIKKQPLDSSQLDVLSGGVKAGVVVLPVHDSFITLREWALAKESNGKNLLRKLKH